MITISNSEMTAWDRSRRKWLALYYFGVAPAEESVTSNRLLGVRVHTSMEGYYGYELDPVAVLGVIYAQEIEEHPDEESALRKEQDMALAMVEGYLEWLAETGEDNGLKVVQTEQDLQIPMPGREAEVLLRARMDSILFREIDEKLLFLDHKTAANFDKHELLALDVQMPHYCLMQQIAAAEGGPQVAGGIINTLRRVKRTARSTPPYYMRDTFYFNPDQIATAWHRANAIVSEIMAARARLDDFFSRGPDLQDPSAIAALNAIQREHMRPTPMINDCSWSCPLAQGLCTAMSDGSDWLGMMFGSGHWVQVDPYEYYRDAPFQRIQSALSGTVEPDQEAGSR